MQKSLSLWLISPSLFLIVILSVLNISCSSKAPQTQNMNLAGNRVMAVALKSIKSVDGSSNAESAFVTKLTEKAIGSAYGSKTFELRLDGGPLESPEALYQMGKLEIDDLFVIEVNVKGPLEISPSPAPDIPVETPSAENMDSYIEVSASIYNGANLRAVNVFTFKAPTKPGALLEKNFVEAFKKASLSAFPNPNIYPKNSPKHYADLLYTYSVTREKQDPSPLTCENATDRLRYYEPARVLYDLAVARGSSRAVGTQAELHQLTTRQSEAASKSQIVAECLADQNKSFELKIEYGSIAPESQAIIAKMIAESNLETLLKQYTSKPVILRFQVENNGMPALFTELRFDRDKYRAWTMNRIPPKIKNFQILSLDPYYALMQKLVLLRTSLPETAPFELRSGFASMRVMLVLKTLINGQISFGADGKYDKETKRLAMAYPNTLFLSLPGFDAKTVANRDIEIFQEKGWIALGNCKTIEGTKTEDGLVYDFFGFPCQ